MFAFTHPLKNIFPRRGRIRVQRYENILNYANENAKNVRNICKKVRNLTKSAIKELIWNPIQVQERMNERKN